MNIVGKRIKAFYSGYGWCTGEVIEQTADKVRIKFDLYPDYWENWPSGRIRILGDESEKKIDDEQKAVLEKIKKLFALSTSPVQAEAELAVQKAEELMLEYKISRKQFEESTSKYFEEYIPCGKLLYQEYLSVARLLSDFFHVEYFVDNDSNHCQKETGIAMIYSNGRGITFVGTRTNLEIAEYIFTYLTYVFRKLYRKHKKEDRTSFMIGVAEGFRAKLELTNKKIENQYGIVLVKKDPGIEEFMKEQHDLKSLSRHGWLKDINSYEKGLEEGKKIELHDGLSNGGDSTKLISNKS